MPDPKDPLHRYFLVAIDFVTHALRAALDDQSRRDEEVRRAEEERRRKK